MLITVCHWLPLLPIATIDLVGNNREFEVQGIFWGAIPISTVHFRGIQRLECASSFVTLGWVKLCDFQFKRTENHNFTNNQYEPACGILSLFDIFLSCWTNDVEDFFEGYLNNFSTELSSQIFDCCPRNFLIQEKQNGNVVSTSHWIRLVLKIATFRIKLFKISNYTAFCMQHYQRPKAGYLAS